MEPPGPAPCERSIAPPAPPDAAAPLAPWSAGPANANVELAASASATNEVLSMLILHIPVWLTFARAWQVNVLVFVLFQTEKVERVLKEHPRGDDTRR